MAINFGTTPTYPLPGAISITVVCTVGNFWRAWLTDCPRDSVLYTKLTAAGGLRLQLAEGTSSVPLKITFDVPGVYTLRIQEYTKGASATRGGYVEAPQNFATETKISEETAKTVIVGSRLECELGVGGDRARLLVHVWGDTIRQTFTESHGVVSPSVIGWTNDKARTSALAVNVANSTAALIGVTAATALGSASGALDNIISKFNLHRVQSGVHAANDTDNVISTAYKSASSPEALWRSISEVVRLLRRHMLNDSGTGTGSAAYHNPGTVNTVDWTNLPNHTGAGDVAPALAAIGAIWNAYEAHRVSTIHATSDTTNTLTALTKILQVHADFGAALQSASPSVPASANSGAVVLVHGAGFREIR